jgi:hypothetical protein
VTPAAASRRGSTAKHLRSEWPDSGYPAKSQPVELRPEPSYRRPELLPASWYVPRPDGYSTSPGKGKARWGEQGWGLKPMGSVAHPSYCKTQQSGLQVGTMVRPIFLASLVALLPISVQGQGRVMMPAASHSMAAPPRVAAHITTPPAVSQAKPLPRIVVRSTAPRLRTTASPTARVTRRPVGIRRHSGAIASQLKPGCSSVPGLGFDVPHLAAICGPAAVGAGLSGNQLPLFFPSFGGGFFLPNAPVVVEEAAPEGPQEENAEAEVAETPRHARVIQPAPVRPQVEEVSAAPRQMEEFVFVRRDGTLFFAVAYAWENGTLRYVTSEGLRHSVAREALDLNATQQFNEQRGLNFRSPA